MKKKDISKVNVSNPYVWIRSYIRTKRSKFKLEKIDIDTLKPPYVILTNHSSAMVSFIASRVAYPYSVYNVCEELHHISSRGKITYTRDIYNEYNSDNTSIHKKIFHAIDSGKIVVMYPELSASLDGTSSVLSDSIASFLKKLEVPVVILKNNGTYIASPIWSNVCNDSDIISQMYMLCDDNEIKTIAALELQEKIKKNFIYDDYSWQRSQKIAIMSKDRCTGLEKILYKCPKCLEENKIVSKGDKIYCSSCGKQWEMTEYGDIRASLDDQEYIRIPDWYAYERECVKEDVLSGNYDKVYRVIVEELDKKGKVRLLEPGILWHNNEGFILKYSGRGKEETLVFSSKTMPTCHIEFNYRKSHDSICLRYNDSDIYIYSREDNLGVTSIKLAVEEMYKLICDSKLFVEQSGMHNEEEVITVDIEELIESEEKIENENEGKVIAIEYYDDNIVTKEQAMFIREQAKTVETDEVP